MSVLHLWGNFTAFTAIYGGPILRNCSTFFVFSEIILFLNTVTSFWKSYIYTLLFFFSFMKVQQISYLKRTVRLTAYPHIWFDYSSESLWRTNHTFLMSLIPGPETTLLTFWIQSYPSPTPVAIQGYGSLVCPTIYPYLLRLEEMYLYSSQGYLHIRECNGLDWKWYSALRFLTHN